MPTQASGSKIAARKKSNARNSAPRAKVQVLTAFRNLDPHATMPDGFVRAIKLGTDGALLESPDPFQTGQAVALEFLLDNDNLAKTTGTVSRVDKKGAFYFVDVTFDKLGAPVKRLITKQIGK